MAFAEDVSGRSILEVHDQRERYGGQIWVKSFGDKHARAASDRSGAVARLASSCTVATALRATAYAMVVYSDDDDSSTKYSDVTGSLMT